MNSRNRVLVVDDEPEVCTLLKETLEGEHYRVTTAASGEQALQLLAREPFPVVVLDMIMDGVDGLSVLQELRAQRPETKVIMLTAHASMESVIEALRLGAFDYLRKGPQIWDEIALKVGKAFETLGLNRQNMQLRRALERTQGVDDMVGTSQAMQTLRQLIARVAGADVNVLIQGETGTGKELVAKAIHAGSARQEKSFVPVDCNIPETLAEAMLFGVTKNFPGLHRKEPLTGLFELADGGTLFLDEIGDLPLTVQPKLLRALQERAIRPLGAPCPVRVDVRVLAATNHNLTQAIQSGYFRADLYYRLNGIMLETTPLRERQEDIPALVQHCLAKACEKMKRPLLHLADAALQALLDYDYPGNVRELENLIDRAVILTSGDTILPNVLPLTLEKSVSQGLMESLSQSTLTAAHTLLEKTYLELQLRHTQGNISQAARRAGMDRKNFRQKLKKHHIGEHNKVRAMPLAEPL